MQGFDFVAEEDDADAFGRVGGEDVEGVAAGAEGSGLGGKVVAGVLDGDEARHHGVAVGAVARAEGDDHAAVVFGGAEAVDAGDGGDDDGVGAVDERVGGGEAEAVDFVVGGGVFFDVGVGLGNVGLGLVVVVVADEVLDGVAREEFLELGVELGGEGLVMAHDEGRAADARDDVRHGEGLAAAGDAFEGAVAAAGGEGGAYGVDGLRLVAGRREGGDELEGGVHAGRECRRKRGRWQGVGKKRSVPGLGGGTWHGGNRWVPRGGEGGSIPPACCVFSNKMFKIGFA